MNRPLFKDSVVLHYFSTTDENSVQSSAHIPDDPTGYITEIGNIVQEFPAPGTEALRGKSFSTRLRPEADYRLVRKKNLVLCRMLIKAYDELGDEILDFQPNSCRPVVSVDGSVAFNSLERSMFNGNRGDATIGLPLGQWIEPMKPLGHCVNSIEVAAQVARKTAGGFTRYAVLAVLEIGILDSELQ